MNEEHVDGFGVIGRELHPLFRQLREALAVEPPCELFVADSEDLRITFPRIQYRPPCSDLLDVDSDGQREHVDEDDDGCQHDDPALSRVPLRFLVHRGLRVSVRMLAPSPNDRNWPI